MSIPLPALRLAQGGPDTIARARSATLYVDVTDPTTGLAAEITTAGSSFELRDPSQNVLVTGGAITSTTKGRAEYALSSATVPATLPYDRGYREIWSIVIGGTTYTLERDAAICRTVPIPQVGVEDLLTLAPQLDGAAPPRQGGGSSWKPQIDEAWRQINQRLADDDRRPWLIWSGGSIRTCHLNLALSLAFRVNSTRLADSLWHSEADRYLLAFEAAWGQLSFDYNYDDDALSVARETATPAILFSAGPRGRGRAVLGAR